MKKNKTIGQAIIIMLSIITILLFFSPIINWAEKEGHLGLLIGIGFVLYVIFASIAIKNKEKKDEELLEKRLRMEQKIRDKIQRENQRK